MANEMVIQNDKYLFVCFTGVPDSPTKPTIMSDIRARSLTISWLSGFDGYGPLRNYTIQYRKRGGMWMYVPDSPLANVTSFTVTK